MQPGKEEPTVSGPLDIVMVSEGVDLYNLGKDRQISFITIYDQKHSESRTFQIPKLKGQAGGVYLKEGETKDSLPIVGTLHKTPDGTIYVGGAGGVLNRLTPDGDDGYTHSFAILTSDKNLGDQLSFQNNPAQVTLLAVGDKVINSPEIMRVDNGVEVAKHFFDSYQERQADFDVLIEQGMINKEEKTALWAQKKQAYNGSPFTVRSEEITLKDKKISLTEGYKYLTDMTDEERESSPLKTWMESKNGPTKRICIKIWDRNTNYFSEEKECVVNGSSQMMKVANEVLLKPAVEKLTPDLWSDWQDNLVAPESGKLKIYDERLLIHRVNLTSVPGDENQILVSEKDKLYRLDHSKGTMTFSGTVERAATRDIDHRALIPLNERTFIIGDMGTVPEANGAATFRVVVDDGAGNIQTSAGMTKALQDGYKPFWREPTDSQQQNGTPRVENLMSERLPDNQEGRSQLRLTARTKHVGTDLVTGTVAFNGQDIKVSDVHKTEMTDKTNNEYMMFVGGQPIGARQLECIVREDQSHVKGGVKSAKMTDMCEHFQGVSAVRPAWNYWTATGYSAVIAMPAS